MISQIIGEVRGPIPCISERVFNMLNAPDPFEPNKCMKDTYVFVVFPSEVTRFAGPQTPLDFDDKGNLVVVPADQVQNGKKLVISLTLTNIRLLCSYPLKGRENMPVFNMFDSGLLLNQHSASSDKTRVWFMARCIAEASRKLPYDAQAELVGEVGFGVTPIRIRVLSNVISILESGTCPDGRTPWSYVRGTNLDIVKWHDKPCYVVAGGYACFSGLRLGFREVSFTHQDLGVVPGIPADVSQPQQFGT
jgi:hypothetical protein